jgi:hypothetical protein
MRLCRLGFLALGMVVGAGALDAQTTLRFQFKEGDKFDYVLDQTMNMSTKVGVKDDKVTVTIKQSMDMSWEVLKVDKNGSGQVQMRFKHVKMDMAGPMGKVHVDSSNPKELDDPVGRILSQVAGTLAGLEVTFTMDPTGGIKDLKMPEKVKNSLKSMPGAEAMGDLFSDEGLKRMANGGVAFPKEPVSKEQTWKENVDMKMPMGRVKGQIQFTYQGTEEKDGKKLEKIAAKPDIKIEPAPDTPFQMKVTAQDGKGTVYFDNEAGRIIEVTMDQDMEMSIDANNMNMKQQLKQNTSMKLKK